MKKELGGMFILLLAVAGLAHGQSSFGPAWSRIELAGSTAKMYDRPTSNRFNILFTSGFAGQPEPMVTSIVALQEEIMHPEIFGQLFEKLGGEFMLGDHTGTGHVIRPAAGSARPMPGLQLGLRVGRQFGLQGGVRYYRMEWKGDFPVTVFPQGQSTPEVRNGQVWAEQSGLLTELLLGWQLTGRRLQPYVRAGLRASLPLQGDSGYELAGVQLPWKADLPGRTLAPVAAAGLRVVLLKSLLLEAGVSGGKLPGSGYCVLPEIGIGFGF